MLKLEITSAKCARVPVAALVTSVVRTARSVNPANVRPTLRFTAKVAVPNVHALLTRIVDV